MKNAYKSILGFIFALTAMGGLSCVDVSSSNSSSVDITVPDLVTTQIELTQLTGSIVFLK
jgi:hypothetical protein